MRSLIILNDIRPEPLLTVMVLSNRLPNPIVLVDETILFNGEYGNNAGYIWGLFVRFILCFIKSCHVFKGDVNDENPIHISEIKGLQSSLYSITCDSSACADKYPKIYRNVKKLVFGSRRIVDYLSKQSLINTTVYIFNGRTASSYGIVRYCFDRNIPIFFYEFAAHCNGFRMFSVPPHATGKLGEYILSYYKKGYFSSFKSTQSALQYEYEKINSSFAKANKRNNDMRYDIVIFLGSDFEYTSIDEDICGVKWLGNAGFCRKVIEKYGIERQYCVRCHPNSAQDPNWPALLEELKNSVSELRANVKYVLPNDKLDSHEIIKNSVLIATDLSSIAEDAFILGANVDIFGNTKFRMVQKDTWFSKYNSTCSVVSSLEPHAIGHNHFVFRFPKFLRIISHCLVYVYRIIAKANTVFLKKNEIA